MFEGRLISVAGLTAVIGNVVAVAALHELPASYRVARLESWREQVLNHPYAAGISAFAFTVGLIALAVWAYEVGNRLRPSGRVGARLVAFGSLLNAAGTLTPLVLAFHVGPTAPDGVGYALLGITLTLDALFNLTLACGFGLIAMNLTRREAPRLRWLAWCVAITSLPVTAQAVFDPAASLLVISGPLWLIFVTATSVQAWRSRPEVAHA